MTKRSSLKKPLISGAMRRSRVDGGDVSMIVPSQCGVEYLVTVNEGLRDV